LLGLISFARFKSLGRDMTTRSNLFGPINLKYFYTFNIFIIFFKNWYIYIYNPWCPGQLTRITTNPRTHWTPCKPSRQVRHRGGDKRACWSLNPGCKGIESWKPCQNYWARSLGAKKKIDIDTTWSGNIIIKEL
jgi:hypothetical protein